MQFHDLAREVFVQAALVAGIARRRAFGGGAVGADGARLIQKNLHRRMTLGRDQHVLEAPEHVRADRLGFERTGEHRDGRFFHRHREVVRPEMHEPFDERRARGERAHDRASTAAR